MSSIRKVFRVFLASPGDLGDERKAIRGAVDELNESFADDWGYQIELLVWEDTVAQFGRPQHLINDDVDRCDLFIGMIWKRWGTPTDRYGGYSSGFQEEFEHAKARRESSESPEISLFFKKIPKEYREDPGDDLKRVLEFRDEIVAKRELLFQEFSTERDMEMLARKCVASRVVRERHAGTSSVPDGAGTKTLVAEGEEPETETDTPRSSPAFAEGHLFLKDLVERIGRQSGVDGLEAFDIARFRLLANSVSTPSNEDISLGVHDINLIYTACSNGMQLSKREIAFLARFGFRHFAGEKVPLWCWYSLLSDYPVDIAVICS